MNQDKNDRKDRTGGDVTKATELEVDVPKTKWDVLNATGPGRTSEE